MEGEAARRRINMVAGHFAAKDDSFVAGVLPMNCHNSLSSVCRRCDSKMYFSRQESSSQACYMRQTSIELDGSNHLCMPAKISGCTNEHFRSPSEWPLFSRPARMEKNFQTVGFFQPLTQGCKLSALEAPPVFSRPNKKVDEQKQFRPKTEIYSSDSNGIKWSPRMDVVEAGRNYIMTVEIPGVSINDIRVEIDDQKLIVTGKRSTWEVASSFRDSVFAYQKKEILQGPYELVWPLPADVNKDGVSAEFWDGFLKITIPKLLRRTSM